MKFLHGKILEPSGLSKKDKDHGYEFYATTFRLNDSKVDKELKFLGILYFRNIENKIFGKIDYSKFTTSQNMRAVATKVIKDKSFREQFVIPNPEEKIFFGKWR